MFGLPTFHLYDEEYFETPEEAEQWIKEHPTYKILGAFKEPDERFREYRFNRAITRSSDMRKYNAVILYQWRS